MSALPPLDDEPTSIGRQTLVSGVAPILSADRLALRAAAPLRSPKSQKAAARDQLDLFARREQRR